MQRLPAAIREDLDFICPLGGKCAEHHLHLLGQISQQSDAVARLVGLHRDHVIPVYVCRSITVSFTLNVG